MDPVVLSLGGGSIAILIATVGRLWVDLKDERKGRLEDAKAYTATLLEVQQEMRSEDKEEIERLRAKVDGLVKAQDPPGRSSLKSDPRSRRRTA